MLGVPYRHSSDPGFLRHFAGPVDGQSRDPWPGKKCSVPGFTGPPRCDNPMRAIPSGFAIQQPFDVGWEALQAVRRIAEQIGFEEERGDEPCPVLRKTRCGEQPRRKIQQILITISLHTGAPHFRRTALADL
jgi:hypothetical protein